MFTFFFPKLAREKAVKGRTTGRLDLGAGDARVPSRVLTKSLDSVTSNMPPAQSA